jgi:predicted DNA-binding transcriptional regulator AlpA
VIYHVLRSHHDTASRPGDPGHPAPAGDRGNDCISGRRLDDSGGSAAHSGRDLQDVLAYRWENRFMKRSLSETRPVPRRGLSRVESAMYVGVSPGKFDEMVKDGRMPQPLRIDGRKVWDMRELDLCFDELPRHDAGAVDTWADA